ncbi:MAG: ABC transporter permease [Chloroflexota bacterium]
MVPLARRNLFQDKVRLVVSVGGVAFALLLILALDGIVAGSLDSLTAYIKRTGAQIYIAQPGVRSMHMAASAIPLGKVAQVRDIPSVARVDPVLYASSAITVGDNRQLAYVYGFEPTSHRSGPWQMASGSADLQPGEVVIDVIAASKLGVGLGDEVSVLGRSFRVRGLSEETYNFVNSFAFMRLDDFSAARGQADTASYLLVWLAEGESSEKAAERIRAAVAEVEVTTSTQFANEEARLVRDMTAEIMVIMNTIGFVIGLAAAGLTVYTATLAKLPEYGVLKALGAGNGWLYRTVAVQAFWSVALAAVIAIALAYALAMTVQVFVPSLRILIEFESLGRAVGAAAAISVVAALLPVRQVSGLDPATVFRH